MSMSSLWAPNFTKHTRRWPWEAAIGTLLHPVTYTHTQHINIQIDSALLAVFCALKQFVSHERNQRQSFNSSHSTVATMKVLSALLSVLSSACENRLKSLGQCNGQRITSNGPKGPPCTNFATAPLNSGQRSQPRGLSTKHPPNFQAALNSNPFAFHLDYDSGSNSDCDSPIPATATATPILRKPSVCGSSEICVYSFIFNREHKS